MPLTQLIYTSRVAVQDSKGFLEEILQSSMRYNQRNGITGMLLFSRGAFVQALEGREASVDETYAKICRDPRHQELVILERAPILRRSFGEWTMGFHHGDSANADLVPGYTPILDTGFTATELIQDPNFAKNLLQRFAANSRLPMEDWTAAHWQTSTAKPKRFVAL